MAQQSKTGLVGLSDADWQRHLADLHRRSAYEELARSLTRLENEIGRERLALQALDSAPWYHRYQQVARFHLTPAQQSELFGEMNAELRLQTHYERVLERARLPKSLWKYLDMAGVKIAPDPAGLQYAGFGKYGGTGSGADLELVTFFAQETSGSPAPQVPAHFFSRWQQLSGRFVVDRAYRGALPRGSGSEVTAELLLRAAPPQDLRTFRLENVVNGNTYADLVRENEQGDPELIEGADFWHTALGRFVRRVLREVHAEPRTCRTGLSALGHLHVEVDVAAAAS